MVIFLLKGTNSKLINENIIIKAESIDGNFSENANEKEITYLNVIDKKYLMLKIMILKCMLKKLILIMILQLLN